MPNAEGPGSISDWRTRSHMLQLRVPCLLRLTPELIGKCEDVETKNIYGGGGGMVTVWTIDQTCSRVTESPVP